MTFRTKAAPVLKWAGGKSRLIPQLVRFFPVPFPPIYVEPFVGSGALLLWILEHKSELGVRTVLANDHNSDLILMYRTIQTDVESLIRVLSELQSGIRQSADPTQYYLARRAEYNSPSCSDAVRRSALLIFLNKTCFNGLYRVNAKGEFNVPFGKNPFATILNAAILRRNSEMLKGVRFTNEDYKKVFAKHRTNEKAFYYFDPPYRPLIPASSFNQYTKEPFGEWEQIQLAEHCRFLSDSGELWMLSNSDTRTVNPSDNFYETQYSGFCINTIFAPRMINSNPNRRGGIPEVLITNYDTSQIRIDSRNERK